MSQVKSQVIEGDLFNVRDGIILHQVNCMGKMGAGLAGALAKRYPKVKREYELKYRNAESRDELFGDIQSVKVGDKLFIVNSFSQKYYGRNVDFKYTDEDVLIDNIKKTVEVGKEKGMMVYIPYKIGSGLGNGDWDYIYENIKDLDLVIVNKE